MLLLCLWGTRAASGWFKDLILLSSCSCVGSDLPWVSCSQVFKSSHWFELCERFVAYLPARGCECISSTRCSDFGGSVGWKPGLEFDYFFEVSRLNVVKVLSVYSCYTDPSASATGCHKPKRGCCICCIFICMCAVYLKSLGWKSKVPFALRHSLCTSLVFVPQAELFKHNKWHFLLQDCSFSSLLLLCFLP